MTVSADPDELRATFQPITFSVSPPPNLEVTLLNCFVDVAKIRQETARREMDQPAIAAITAANRKQCEIIAFCKDNFAIGERTVQDVLRRYKDDLWTEARLLRNNGGSHEVIHDFQ